VKKYWEKKETGGEAAAFTLILQSKRTRVFQLNILRSSSYTMAYARNGVEQEGHFCYSYCRVVALVIPFDSFGGLQGTNLQSFFCARRVSRRGQRRQRGGNR